MFNNSGLRDESLLGTMQALAGYLIDDLQEIQQSGELLRLMEHTDPDIRQEAMQIFHELDHFIGSLGKI